MFRLAVIAWCALSLPASATNWEGHDDDWTRDISYGKAFEAAIPGARPLPSKNCERRQPALPGNAYEQIDLPAWNCPKHDDARPKS